MPKILITDKASSISGNSIHSLCPIETNKAELSAEMLPCHYPDKER